MFAGEVVAVQERLFALLLEIHVILRHSFEIPNLGALTVPTYGCFLGFLLELFPFVGVIEGA